MFSFFELYTSNSQVSLMLQFSQWWLLDARLWNKMLFWFVYVLEKASNNPMVSHVFAEARNHFIDKRFQYLNDWQVSFALLECTQLCTKNEGKHEWTSTHVFQPWHKQSNNSCVKSSILNAWPLSDVDSCSAIILKWSFMRLVALNIYSTIHYRLI